MLVPTALLFLAVPGLAILFTIAAAAIAAALRWRERDWKGILLPAGGGLLLGLLLYLPTLFRYGAAVVGDGFNPNYVLPFQLFSSLWGLATSTGSYLDHFPLQIGVVPVGLAIVALALAWRKPSAVESNETPGTSQPIDEGPRQTDAVVGAKPGLDDPAGDKTDAARDAPSVPIDRSALVRAVIIFLVAAVVFALLTFEIAAPIWNVLGLFATYPWQILAFVGLALAVAAGSVIDFEPSFSRPAMLAFFVALPVVLSYGYLAPNYLDYAPTRPQIAVFGRNEIALWDYRIVGPLRHGATLRVYLTWQALGVVDHDYTVFIHAVNADGNTYGQVDTKPVDGTMPTYKWQPGQVVSDTQTIQIDVDGPREGYHLELGLYQAANGGRAPIVGGGDALILPRPGDPEPVISEVLPTDSN